MPSYEPVDLSGICNAGVEVLGDEPGDVPLGRVDLRGLPFLIGPEPPSAERCLLLPGAPTSVGIGRLARRVIIAHRLLEPGAPAGHAVGQTVAEYAFHLAGGEVVVAPIRERFEIQVVPTEWGRLPFLAVPDTSDHNLPDRKSTRLNSSHGYISYAVFCLKKKKNQPTIASIPHDVKSRTAYHNN